MFKEFSNKHGSFPNDIACERYGYTKEEFSSMTPLDITHLDSQQKIPERVESLHIEPSSTFEMVHQTKDGRTFPVEISAHKFKLGYTDVTLSAVRDISDRKKAEKEIVTAFEQIEKNLEQFSVLIDSIRNPLAVIVGLIDQYGKDEKEIAIKHVNLIDDIISHIDERTQESREVRDYLKKYFD